MITTPQEYYDNLYKIQDKNPPSLAVLLPSDEKIFKIDLNTREIEAPEFLSVLKDHYAETIYFRVPRYFDHFDLSTTTCLIEYINADGEHRFYAVPFYDVTTYPQEILFPWCIDGDATKAAGMVEYHIRFYKIEPNSDKFSYNLNTLPAKSEVLYGIGDINNEDIEEVNDYLSDLKDQIFARLDAVENYDLYWLDM